MTHTSELVETSGGGERGARRPIRWKRSPKNWPVHLKMVFALRRSPTASNAPEEECAVFSPRAGHLNEEDRPSVG